MAYERKNYVPKQKFKSEDANRIEDALCQFYNPNLLINSDFRNPINQRGQTSYTTSGYTVDRWRTVNATSVTVQEGSIKLEQPSDAQYTGRFKQIFETPLSGYLTIQVKVLECTAKTYITQFDSIPSGFSGIYTYTSANLSSLEAIEFYIAQGHSITIEWIKLEQGSLATPFVPRHRAEELALCRKFYKIVKVCSPCYQHDSTTAYFDVQFYGAMVQKPKVTCSKHSFHKPTGGTVTTKKLEMLSDYDNTHCLWYATFDTISSPPSYFRLSATFIIDAEI